MCVSTRRCGFAALILILGACVANPTGEVANQPAERDASKPARATAPARPITQALGPRSNRITPRLNKQERIDEIYTPGQRRFRSAGQRPARRPGDINLEFRDTDMREVIRAVLGDILKRNFVIDANVNGRVTLTTDRPLHRDELLPTLEAILGAQGAKLVDFGGVFRVTRSNQPATLSGGGLAVGGGVATGRGNLRLFVLDHIGAVEMSNILKPLLPNGAVVASSSKRNLLIVGGSGPELRLATSTIKIFDVNQMVDRNVLLIGIQNADPRTVIAELNAVFGAEGASNGANAPVEFVAIERLNAILVLAAQRSYVDRARDWIYRLDRSRDPTQRRLFVYYVQNGRAVKLAESLRGVVGDIVNSEGAATEPNTIKPTPTGGSQRSAQTAAATARPQSGFSILGDGVSISVDAEHNALLISATPKDFELIDELLAKLDIPPSQVMIEATIFEVDLNDELRFGLQYAISNGGLGITRDGNIGLTRTTTTAVSAGNIITPVIAPRLPGFSFTIEGNSRTRFILDTLSSLTELNVISSPNILVLNNHSAQLQVGDEVPIITQTTTSTTTENPLIVNSVQYRSTGVSLEVTPQVNASGMVTLEITQNVSDVATTTTSSINSPTIKNRSLVSTVTVKSGDTVMLGGLIRENTTSTSLGIPLLHDLPLIGALFGQKSNRADRTELVILLRPSIAASPADAQRISEEIRRKFQVLLRNQKIGIRQPRRISADESPS